MILLLSFIFFGINLILNDNEIKDKALRYDYIFTKNKCNSNIIRDMGFHSDHYPLYTNMVIL